MPIVQRIFLITTCCLSILVSTAHADTVCVVGAGTIGSSFAAVFLAQGKTVVCSDQWVTDPTTLHDRITDIWPTLRARGLTRSSSPNFRHLSLEPDLSQAIVGVDHVQECVYEDVSLKQEVLRNLDQLVPEDTIIASSTSYIPLDLLTAKCRRHKGRIVIAHPSIPHWGSFMELCGTDDTIVQAAKKWYSNAGFDCVVMNKTVFGHVWNSFLTLNLRHGEKLIQSGVCSAQDVNTVLRHLGREFYARHLFLSLLVAIGGEQGLEGGLVLRRRVAKSAIAIIFSSTFRWIPGSRLMASSMARLLRGALVPDPNENWINACRDLQETITQQGTLTTQRALFDMSKLMYTKIPLEVGKDPFATQGSE